MVPDLSPFMHLRRFVSIVHHVPGRIRLKLDIRALAELPQVDPAPFTALVGRLRGVKATRVNLPALSVVVEYDPALIAVPVWARLLTDEPDEVARLVSAHVA